LPEESSLREKIERAYQNPSAYQGVCYRNVRPKRAGNLLSSPGSLVSGGRYNFKGLFEVLYLSCDVHTCVEETTRSLTQNAFDVAKTLPRLLVSIEVKLSKVLDFTDSRVRRDLGITKKVLTETDWASLQEAEVETITQAIGRLTRDVGFEAIFVPSATRLGNNLDVFPDNLLSDSILKVANEEEIKLGNT